ncbi:MAG: hypothetical protein KKH73_01295, partial [Actinobacteria bacterium]|nr:hypothetical protein [Actinomycetota bacterium]
MRTRPARRARDVPRDIMTGDRSVPDTVRMILEVRVMYIAVVGAGDCDGKTCEIAYQVGLEIAGRGHVLVCGGLG